MQACDRCHARKTRCDRGLPKCGACTKSGHPCLHTNKLEQRNYPRGYIEDLEKKVKNLENQNHELRKFLHRNSVASTSNEQPPDARESSSKEPQSPPSTTHGEEAVLPGSSQGDSHTEPTNPPLSSTNVENLAEGEGSYLGSSGSVEFARIVQSVVDSANCRNNLFETASIRNDGIKNPSPPVVPRDAPKPPRELALPLVSSYFSHWAVTFPLLHRPSFMNIFQQIYDHPGYYSRNTFDAFIFDMVLAMGSASSNRLEWSVSGTETHFSRATNKLDQVLGMKGIMPLQALLFCCQYGVFASLRDTSAQMWHLLGIASRLSSELGLHRESNTYSHRSTEGRLTSFEIEMRRRCFWCFYNLDRAVSQTLGRPVAIRDEDIDVLLPSSLDDDQFGPSSTAIESNGGLSPFLHLIRLRHLSGKISQSLHINTALKSMTSTEKSSIRRGLRSELEAWRADVSKLELPAKTREGAPPGTFKSSSWYEVLYHNAVLLLYRPSPMFPNPGRRGDTEHEEGELQQLLDSAKASIKNYAELLRNRRLNYSWITLYACFMAGLAYVYGVGRSTKHKRQGRQVNVPHYLEVIENTRSCSNILVAICERWNDARGSCEIFDQLSNAVIQEAVKASYLSQPSAPMSPTQGQHIGRQLPPPQQRPLSAFEPPNLTMDGAVVPAASPVQSQYAFANAATPAAFSSPDDFQHAFQDLQAAVFHDDFSGPNEVMLGFGQDWFEQDSPSFVGTGYATNGYSNDFAMNGNTPRVGLGNYGYQVGGL